MNQAPIGRHLGRTIAEMLPGPAAEMLQGCIQSVFETGQPVIQFELNTPLSGDATQVRSWLINVYPVKATSEAVRWVGAIVVEATERKRAEDALRKTEKLAAAGRLAASIAHEINNPLEAVTNLLYLLRHQPSLDRGGDRLCRPGAAGNLPRRRDDAADPALLPPIDLAGGGQHRRVVGFRSDGLYGAAACALQIEVSRQCGPDVDLYCFSGELRQLFANLIGNAIDAMGQGGHLWLIGPPLAFVGGRHTRYSVVRCRQWLRHDAGNAPADFRTVFYYQGNDRHRPWPVGEQRDYRQAQCHGAGCQPSGRSGEREAAGTVFMLFFPEGGIGVASGGFRRRNHAKCLIMHLGYCIEVRSYLAFFARCGKETQLKTEPFGDEPFFHISSKQRVGAPVQALPSQWARLEEGNAALAPPARISTRVTCRRLIRM